MHMEVAAKAMWLRAKIRRLRAMQVKGAMKRELSEFLLVTSTGTRGGKVLGLGKQVLDHVLVGCKGHL